MSEWHECRNYVNCGEFTDGSELCENCKEEAKQAANEMSKSTITLEDINYPAGIFFSLIEQNSPYAFYLFQWVPYQTEAKRWRLKMLHDVKTFDGREAFGIWPNSDMCGPFKDEEVEFIRISKDQGAAEWVDTRQE